MLKLVEGEVVAHLVGQVVAGGKGVAGVDADSHAALVVDAADDAGYLAELESEVAALSGGILYDGGDALGLVEGTVDLLGYLVEAGLLGGLVEVGAGVEVEQAESELLAALHLVEECGTGLLQGLFVGIAEVDEIAVVGQHVEGIYARFGELGLEVGDTLC